MNKMTDKEKCLERLEGISMMCETLTAKIERDEPGYVTPELAAKILEIEIALGNLEL